MCRSQEQSMILRLKQTILATQIPLHLVSIRSPVGTIFCFPSAEAGPFVPYRFAGRYWPNTCRFGAVWGRRVWLFLFLLCAWLKENGRPVFSTTRPLIERCERYRCVRTRRRGRPPGFQSVRQPAEGECMRQLWAGIDAGKAHHHCMVIDSDGTQLLSRRVATDEADLKTLVDNVLELSGGAGV